MCSWARILSQASPGPKLGRLNRLHETVRILYASCIHFVLGAEMFRRVTKSIVRTVPLIGDLIKQVRRQAENLETLDAIGLRNGTYKASAQNTFLAFYAQFLDKIRYEPVRVLDIGVLGGASARMTISITATSSVLISTLPAINQ
jgi:hypothetical protein